MQELKINDTIVKIWARSVEPTAFEQIMNIASLPFVFHHLAFMPDVHGGSGRAMSRSEAVRMLDLDAERARMDAKGIIHSMENRRDLEEAASAYKDIDEVMASQSDLTSIVTPLEPIAVIKGA